MQQVVEFVSFLSVNKAPFGIAEASFTLIFFFKNKNNKIINKHNKKLNNIETLASQVIIDMEISH